MARLYTKSRPCQIIETGRSFRHAYFLPRTRSLLLNSNSKKCILNKTVMCCSPVLMTRVTASELNLNWVPPSSPKFHQRHCRIKHAPIQCFINRIGNNAKQGLNVLNSTLDLFLFYGQCIITNLAWPELGFRVRSFKGGFNETRPLLISYKSCPHHKLSSIHIDSQLGSNGLLLSVCVFDRNASGWSLIHDQRKGPRQITFSCAGALWISRQRG